MGQLRSASVGDLPALKTQSESKMFEEEDGELNAAFCSHCLSSLRRLFIKQSPTPQRRVFTKHYHQLRSHHNSKPITTTTTIIKTSAKSNCSLLPLLIAVCLAALCCQRADGQSEIKTNLPTVIVRGFLNYRTTVDGTVLLFTPDAGTTGSQSVSATPSQVLASSASRAPAQIEPSSARTLLASSTFFASLDETTTPARPAEGRGPSDEWRPVQATPPLRGSQTAVRVAPSMASAPLITSVSEPQESLAPGGQQVSQPARDPAEERKPSVQSDEVVSAVAEPQVAKQQAEVATKAPNARAKRPSLGFNGQGVRSRSRSQSNSEAQSSNSINGIRRPGLSTTTSTTAAPSGAQEPASSSMSSFQSRLSASRLRHRFKRPPAAGNASLPVQSVSALAQPAESGEEMSQLGEQLVASVQAISPEQSALQARLGDIFNPQASIGTSPALASEEVLSAAANSRHSQSSGPQELAASSGPDVSMELVGVPSKPAARSGEQRPAGNPDEPEPQLLSGGLSGAIEQSGSMPLTFDSFFQSDQAAQPQPQQPGNAEASEPAPSFQGKEPRNKTKHNNDKLNSWLGQHHNKFVPRNQPQAQQSDHNSQLAANINSLAPSFASNIPSGSTAKPISEPISEESLKPSVGSLDELEGGAKAQQANNGTNSASKEAVQMQTITKTYSTVMTSYKTRLVPLQVKSSTAIHTITENYVITKVLTAYQTMPVGEFILPEPMNTRPPFEMFNEQSGEPSADKSRPTSEQPIAAAASTGQLINQLEPALQAEQPISLDSSPKSPNDWLHDFSNNNNQQQHQQHQNLAAMLEQQAQEANLAGFGLTGAEPLDQLASSLDPSADGSINIPDLNNPLVLAAAIQNPQLAAVILAAQQLQLKQRANKLNQQVANGNLQQQQQQQQQQPQPNQVQLQPSYSISMSTLIRPSVHTVRDTMYTTRLVSFKDGRTVRTRTVSEPGSVIEQVLTTMATEITPVTLTLRPTGVFTLPAGGLQSASPQSSQSTINNALIATQLASLLARRQQQVQPALGGPNFGNSPSGSNPLAALQQLIGQQQQQQQQQNRQQAAKQFQPNLHQLLQSMQQQPSSSPTQHQPDSNPNLNAQTSNSNDNKRQQQQQQQQDSVVQATPTLPAAPAFPAQPVTTTLTNLQVRTYTVHNAFKTIYRTITSTQLVTSTILPASSRNTQQPTLG